MHNFQVGLKKLDLFMKDFAWLFSQITLLDVGAKQTYYNR